MKKLALAAASALAVASASAPAGAVVLATSSTFQFSGTCLDCVPGQEAITPVTGTLVLSNYTVGQAITSANFVSWHYDGSKALESYTISSATVLRVSGSIQDPVPGFQTFSVRDGSYYFSSDSNGNWSTGRADVDFDRGEAGIYAAAVADPTAGVPEPATWGLMLAGFGLVGAGARSRRRSTIVTYA